MIIDIPTPDDFEESGTSFLNLAWTIVVDLYEDTQSEFSALRSAPELTDEFWDAAQRPLSNAVTLVQQGIELLLKARIAEVSPFMLIDGSPRDWPRRSDAQDTPFSAFRMIDAQDLPVAYNTVRADRLPDDFTQRLNELRRLRNTIMHTVDPGLRVQPKDVLITILEAIHHAVAPRSWVRLRREHLFTIPQVVAYSDDHIETKVVEEISPLRSLLTKAELHRFFGMNKNQRWYVCQTCTSHREDDWSRTAQLRPNSPRSKQVFCFVCEQTIPVTRATCPKRNCEGNVIARDNAQCLTCGEGPKTPWASTT